MEWIFPVLAVALFVGLLKLLRGQRPPREFRTPAELDSGAWNAAITGAAIIGVSSALDHLPVDGGIDAGGIGNGGGFGA